ncbi:hybrid sensor histidine kinase/response regulator transcription factor [Botryobacter ruber]|uniref:hybrid sensor histidine kinase/response regulator transcription factor n=1 Tax=Botryobacter ruber TaxID=2171629 RepID=UPI0013E32A5B|nr:hybrid sensor histidine kinase/response regulator transcription factor [Botryobacter ruber]
MKLIIGVCLLGVTTQVRAQLKCKIERYTTEEGLSHDNVTSMLKDREGFMWFGTWDGINRFDGHDFVAYKAYPGDNSKLKNNRIVSIVEDEAGFLWLKAYDNQIYRFDKKTESFFSLEELLNRKGYKSIVFDKVILGKNGYIWLTTKNQGVYCVSKATSAQPSISRFTHEQITGQSRSSSQLNFFYPDKSGTIWIGSPHGLSRLTRNKAGNYALKIIRSDSLNKLNFTAVLEGTNKLWFGTGEGTLVTFDKKTNRVRKHKASDSSINSLCLSRKKQVLYLSNSGRQLITLNLSGVQTSVASMPGKGAFLSIFEDNAGLLWIEPESQGAIMFNPATREFKHFVQPKDATFHPSIKFYHIFEDHQKRIWVSMQGGGFGYYDSTTNDINYFYNKPGSPDQQFSNFVSSLYLDPAGVMWMCTNDRGLNKIIFQENYFDHQVLVQHTANKSENEIRYIFQDSKNRTWIATKGAELYVYEQGKVVTGLLDSEADFGSGIYCMLEDRQHNLWLATKGNGLYKAVPQDNTRSKYRLTHFMPDPNDPYSLNNEQLYCILEDSKGRIWVGTYGGGLNLVEQTAGKTRFLNDKNLLRHHLKGFFEKVRHLNEGPDGAVWAGTTDGLLVVKSDPEAGFTFETYQKRAGDKASLGNNDVQFVLKDSRNTMWLCTSGGGLNKAVVTKNNKLKFRAFTKEDGLSNDYILSAVEDNSGHLWLATEKGISRFDPGKQQFRNYDSYDGLPKAKFSETAAAKLANGRLLFGTRNGYLSFNPAEISNKKLRANMAFTNLQVNNKDVAPAGKNSPLKYNINNTRQIALAHDQNILGIDFTVLDHYWGSKQAYAYRLAGFDEQWHHVKNQHRAVYTNLPPGHYTFEVKSLDPEIYESIPSKKLAITIHPPIWRTTWAYLLYILLTLTLLEIIRRVAFSMIKLRNRISIEQKLTDLKLRFFTNISHELRTPLTLIVNPIEAIANQEELSPKGREYIKVVRKNTSRMVRFINQLLDFRKAQSGKMKLKIAQVEVVSLVKEISSHFAEAAAEKQILLQTVSNVKELYAWLDAEKIDIVLYNLLSNALKFTPNGKVITIEIKHTGNDAFTIKVIDQGVGVPNDKLAAIFELYYEVEKQEGNNTGGTGIGLALAKEFVELHHGKIFAHNNASEGLTVTVALKDGKEHFHPEEIVAVEPTAAEQGQPALPLELLSAEEVTEAVPAVQSALPLVLLVEDNGELRRFLADQLGKAYRVEEAEDGEEGQAKALKLLPDLVISDIMMPKMDGIQLLDKLKNTEATSHIPVILLTAKTSVEHQIEGLNYGADYYITKPFQTDFILASVKNLLAQRKKIFDHLLSDKKQLELSPGEIVITSKDEAFLTEVIKIVEDGMSDPDFSIDAVAETAGMGRTTFYKKFSSLTNLAPVEFVRDMRLQRGKQLMDAGEANISEIAYSVGFNSAGYFSTCFKKKYNCTPSEYLKKLKVEQV